MSGVLKPPSPFAITPHKVSLCILVQIYASPSQVSVPFPFSSVSQHNRLGIFLLALTKVFLTFPPFLFENIADFCIVIHLLVNFYYAFGIKLKVAYGCLGF